MTHSPGPWTAQEPTDDVFPDINITRPDGLAVGVAVVNGDITLEEAKANAAMFAASLELLAFAKALDASWSEAFPGGPDGPRTYLGGLGQLSDESADMWRQCRAAIAKAEGRVDG